MKIGRSTDLVRTESLLNITLVRHVVEVSKILCGIAELVQLQMS